MRFILIFILLFSSFPALGEEGLQPGGQCYDCHSEDYGMDQWPHDVHALSGIGCNDCHGGNPNSEDMDIAKSKQAGFRGAPNPQEIPLLCSKCHSDPSYMKTYNPLLPVDQLEKYWTSIHGKKLKEGDTKVAQCVSCHNAHGIRKVGDAKSPVYPSNLPQTCGHCHADAEYMASYAIPTTQLEDFKRSVHGDALLVKGDVRGAPACNDCHGNHGAQPPGRETIAYICGACHAHNAELFLKSPVAQAFREQKLLDCAECHGKHYIVPVSDGMISDRPDALCMRCHESGDKGALMAGQVQESLAKIHSKYQGAFELLNEAHIKGMDVTKGEDALQSARQALIQAKTEIHSFQIAPVEEKLKESDLSLEKAIGFAKQALREYKTRRLGLAVSTGFIILLTLSLFLKIRTLPPSQNPVSPNTESNKESEDGEID